MTDATGIGIAGTIGAMVLVGSAIVVRRRRGEAMDRYAVMWAAIFVAAFAIAIVAGH